MIRSDATSARELKHDVLNADLVVVGGGMAGTCCAIMAAREGLKTVLIQDRPVLGGNASSEIRLWVLGATCHMGSNNRWAREGGIINELMTENMYRNPDSNPLIWDTVILEKVLEEPNLTLLLNTAAYEVGKSKSDPDTIESVTAFCSQNSTRYTIRAPLFCDASGDGILGFLSGAAFRMGAEKREEFDESFAPGKEYGELLGHSIYFYSKDAGYPVKFVPPSFAIKNVPERIPKYKQFSDKSTGCNLWWIEYGGRLDTVHDSETIKMELWRVVYGVWDYIKNSGNFPAAENLTLEWVGHIPGKRESRRFEGDYMLTQDDVIKRTQFDDAVAFGGWSIDLHPADGVFSERPGCNQYHSPGIYPIPYRTLYSRNIKNLWIAGRIMSSSHVAFGSTRVMGTGAHCGQAAGMAAAICKRDKVLPRDVGSGSRLRELQLRLHRLGQHIPNQLPTDPDDLAQHATLSASSTLKLASLPADGPVAALEPNRAQGQMLPLRKGAIPTITLHAKVAQPTTLQLEIATSKTPDYHTPDRSIESFAIALQPGDDVPVVLKPTQPMPHDGYAFVIVRPNEHVQLRYSSKRLTGVLRTHNHRIEKLSNIGYDDYPVFSPPRRPGAQNFAMEIAPALVPYAATNVLTPAQRPTNQPNAWVADWSDKSPTLSLKWKQPQSIGRVELFFDVDYDHPTENVLYRHPDRGMPFCVKKFRLLSADGTVLAEHDDWRQPRFVLKLDRPIRTDGLKLEILAMNSPEVPPASVMQVRVYA